jgi:hypothetical protein
MADRDFSHPCEHIRYDNRRDIRNVIRPFEKIGKREIASLTGLSIPTVSSLMSELLDSGEVLVIPESVSTGGRPAELYALNPMFSVYLCLAIQNASLLLRCCDARGSMLFEREEVFQQISGPEAITDRIEKVQLLYPGLRVVSISVPGAVLDGTILYIPDYPNLEGISLGKIIEDKVNVHLIIENDVNVFVFAERERWESLVHLLHTGNGPGAGVLVGGNLVGGTSGFAGEVEFLLVRDGAGMIPFGKKLCKITGITDPSARRKETISTLAQVLSAYICILNPSDAALSGFGLLDSDIPDLRAEIALLAPEERIMELHIVDDTHELSMAGLQMLAMDYLTEN